MSTQLVNALSMQLGLCVKEFCVKIYLFIWKTSESKRQGNIFHLLVILQRSQYPGKGQAIVKS